MLQYEPFLSHEMTILQKEPFRATHPLNPPKLRCGSNDFEEKIFT